MKRTIILNNIILAVFASMLVLMTYEFNKAAHNAEGRIAALEFKVDEKDERIIELESKIKRLEERLNAMGR